MTIPITLKVRDTAGTLVLDLNTGGYKAILLPGSDATWRRQTTQSPFVDGNHEISAVLDGLVLDVQVKISGTSWVDVETKRAALMAAVSGSVAVWLLEVGRSTMAETWRANRADSTSPAPAHNMLNLRRDVFLRIPVQPTPAITGI